jgi:hypothetical protein
VDVTAAQSMDDLSTLCSSGQSRSHRMQGSASASASASERCNGSLGSHSSHEVHTALTPLSYYHPEVRLASVGWLCWLTAQTHGAAEVRNRGAW